MRNKRKILRQTMAVTMGLVGIWVFQLTATLPNTPPEDDFFRKLANKPQFIVDGIQLPPTTPTLPFFTSMVVNHYGFLRSHSYLPPEVEEILPPMPEPYVPEEVPQEEEEEVVILEEDWLTTTMTGQDSFLENQGIYVSNNGKVTLTEGDLSSSTLIPLEKDQEAPQILIYHSHGTESYTQTTGYTYEESDPYRTLDMDYNITAVGAAMAEVFRDGGYSVIHDKSLHDYPDYNASYSNSGEMLQAYLAEYPSLEYIFDVHRDALTSETGVPYQLVAEDDSVAQVMLVVGTDGGGYDHPLWRDNFSLALTIQSKLLQYPLYARPITLRSSRFNQQYATGALLLEIGGHGNTFPQALAGGILFAETVVALLEE